ncbi:MAG: hypothetical protein R3C10_26490 [Pirellulales bacterium]
MRLAPPGYQRFIQAHSFDVSYAGGEANVAASLAQFGHEASFVTVLPDNALADAAIAFCGTTASTPRGSSAATSDAWASIFSRPARSGPAA